MSSARKIHREVCSLLLASLESLQEAHQQFLDLLHPHPAGTGSNPVERLKAKIQVTDCNKRLQHLSDMVKVSLLYFVSNLFGLIEGAIRKLRKYIGVLSWSAKCYTFAYLG